MDKNLQGRGQESTGLDLLSFLVARRVQTLQWVQENPSLNFNEMKNKILQNPEVLEEYNNLKPEYDIINTILTARKEMQITQEELALKTGLRQSDIDEIESGTINPTVDILQKLANAMNMNLKFEFVPKA